MVLDNLNPKIASWVNVDCCSRNYPSMQVGVGAGEGIVFIFLSVSSHKNSHAACILAGSTCVNTTADGVRQRQSGIIVQLLKIGSSQDVRAYWYDFVFMRGIQEIDRTVGH